MDFIINVATGTDANRNLKKAFANPRSTVRNKYERFLGSNAFFTNPANIFMANTNQDDRLRAQFRKAYQDALAAEGYRYIGIEPVRHYYDLVFASKHSTGLKLWRKAQQIRPDSQATLDLES